MSATHPSHWAELFDRAIEIIRKTETAIGFQPQWSFGGGTALMLEIDHRESYDIDIFLDDPQMLPYLNPETQGYQIASKPSSYSTDGTQTLRLSYKDLGEIDFICCSHVLSDPTSSGEVNGHHVIMDRPGEIIAKKIYYRGSSLQPRDMFDLSAVAEHFGTDYVVAAMKQCGADRCSAALDVVERVDPEFVRKIIGNLMLRDNTMHLAATAQSVTARLLKVALKG
jgi:hypothetical protein